MLEARVRPRSCRLPGDKIRAAKDQTLQGDCRANPLDDQFVQGAAHGGEGLRARRRVNNEFAEERVVIGGNCVTDLDMRVPANARPPGYVERGDPSRRGTEIVVGIFGVDPAFDRMSANDDVFLTEWQGRPEAILICCFTRSIPVTISVTGCSTWIRALTSMK